MDYSRRPNSNASNFYLIRHRRENYTPMEWNFLPTFLSSFPYSDRSPETTPRSAELHRIGAIWAKRNLDVSAGFVDDSELQDVPSSFVSACSNP